MGIKESVSLKPYNTFGLEAKARWFCEVGSNVAIQEIFATEQWKKTNQLILGGGSNILLTKDFDGLVVKVNIEGIEKIKEDENHIYLKVGAGVVWHEFVLYCIENNYAGVENLSLIPGNVGAAPMQNIGAYGVELKNVFHELEAVHIEDGKVLQFDNNTCQFGYRNSIFKNELKGKVVITSVTFKLNKIAQLNTSYGAIEKELESMRVENMSIKAVSDAVINIRRSKLPDPKEIGNSGSFFKNPVVPNNEFEVIKKAHPTIAHYPNDDNTTKIAAGWLIDQAGWKGKTMGNYGVHKNQALVLVNYGGAKGKEIFDLSEEIMQDIYQKYGVQLEREVNVI